jgi:cAMP-dependent protein kinase regulator
LVLSHIVHTITVDTSGSKMFGNTFPGRLGTNNPFGFGVTGSGENEQGGAGAISRVIEEDENDTITSPTTPNFNGAFGGAFGGDGTEGPPSSYKGTSGEGFPAHYGMGRRTSVSAESLNPTASLNDSWTPPFHPKTPDQVARLKKSISGNFLFSHLDDEQSSQVLGAMVEKPIPAKGIKVCEGSPRLSSQVACNKLVSPRISPLFSKR